MIPHPFLLEVRMTDLLAAASMVVRRRAAGLACPVRLALLRWARARGAFFSVTVSACTAVVWDFHAGWGGRGQGDVRLTLGPGLRALIRNFDARVYDVCRPSHYLCEVVE